MKDVTNQMRDFEKKLIEESLKNDYFLGKNREILRGTKISNNSFSLSKRNIIIRGSR